MGTAILEGLIGAGEVRADQALIFDAAEARQEAAAAQGIHVCTGTSELFERSDTLILAVKPQQMDEAIAQGKTSLRTDTLYISIAAGLSIRWFQQRLGEDARIIRVMPNTPALVHTGAAGIALGGTCTEEDAATAATIFNSIGMSVVVPESALDAVTALSGSGPAYFFHMVECLVEAAVAEGLEREQATELAAQTLLGAGRLLKESGESAAVLRQRVTSKGGTTEAALNAFRDHDFTGVVRAAVQAAARRSRELGG
jgi:pyrroline-5-carboxylate reductase